jgi:AraC-like DNA-binding protein
MLSLITEHLLWINAGFLLTLTLIALRHIRHPQGFWGFLFFLDSFIYVSYWIIASNIQDITTLRFTMIIPAIAIAYLFWIFSLSLFRDSFKFGKFHLIIIILKFPVSIVPLLKHKDLNLFGSYGPGVVPALLPGMLFSLALVFHSMLIALEHREDDLVEGRRKIRPFFILLTGSLLLLGLIGFLILKPLGYGHIAEALTAVSNLIICISFVVGILEIPQIYLPDKASKPDYPGDPYVKEKIRAAFETDHIHRTEGLTVRDLAKAIGVQEYKIRRQINGDMGFRNFNDLLNRYRIQDACEVLSDPKQSDVTIIRIAMDTGFPSPGPFNRAFRTIVGITPTEYRRQSLQKNNTISE